jgi:hypothetical protein
VRTLAAALLAAAALAGSSRAAEPERWAGVDETVVERLASSAGRTRWRTFLDGTGDLPLFAFLCAGLVGGFVLGYGYRALFVEQRRSPPEQP